MRERALIGCAGRVNPSVQLPQAHCERTVVLAPDFEAVAGLRGHRHKPARAWQRFSRIERRQVPTALSTAVDRIVALARE